MKKEKQGILVTGSSGFIGRHFVNAVSDQFRLFCIARRSRKESGIPVNPSIYWIQADITNWKNLLNVVNFIRQKGGIDYVVHLAGYYDFSMKDNLFIRANTDDGPKPYQLKSVISHIGLSINSGHYVAYAAMKGEWFLYDDCKTGGRQLISPDNMTGDPYILLYESMGVEFHFRPDPSEGIHFMFPSSEQYFQKLKNLIDT